MKVKFLDLQSHTNQVKDVAQQYFSEIIDSSNFINGKYTSIFEERFADYCGAKYCVATNSGTSALHIAILSVFGQSVNINVPANSFFASAEAIVHANCSPVFKDVDNTCTIDTRMLDKEDKCLPVSLYGNPANLNFFKKENIVHDAAQAVGAFKNGQKIAKFAKATCYSFYAGKNLGAFGEGGCVITDDYEVYTLCKRLVNHGQSKKYIHAEIGYNYRISEFSSASLLAKLPFIDEWNDKRISIAKRYNKNLYDRVKLMNVVDGDKCVYHIYPIFVENKDLVSNYLLNNEIEIGQHYPEPIHNQTPFNKQVKRLVFSEKQCRSQISLPMHPFLTHDQIDYVSEKVLQAS